MTDICQVIRFLSQVQSINIHMTGCKGKNDRTDILLTTFSGNSTLQLSYQLVSTTTKWKRRFKLSYDALKTHR